MRQTGDGRVDVLQPYCNRASMEAYAMDILLRVHLRKLRSIIGKTDEIGWVRTLCERRLASPFRIGNRVGGVKPSRGFESFPLRFLQGLQVKRSRVVYHSQEREEEWIYIISGRRVAEIEDEEFEVGPGESTGFPTGVAHHLRNPLRTGLSIS
jgi:mannose-6-phosphate isomerase-like protein (cupin superfamily)